MTDIESLGAKDPGGVDAINALASELVKYKEDPSALPGELMVHARPILAAWARRMYRSSGAHMRERGSEKHEDRIAETQSWIWRTLMEWRPEAEGEVSGTAAAYLNTVANRLPGTLSTTTRRVAGDEGRAARVAAAGRVALERLARDGKDESYSKEQLEQLAREVLEERLRASSNVKSEEDLRRRMRKDSYEKWLPHVGDILQHMGSLDAAGSSLERVTRDEGHRAGDVRAVAMEHLMEGLTPSEQRRTACAPHLQYLMREVE